MEDLEDACQRIAEAFAVLGVRGALNEKSVVICSKGKQALG